MNDGDAELQTWIAPSDLSNSSWSGLRTILTSGTPSFDAELDQHLAKIRRCGCVHEAGMTFAAHGFQHSESRHRIDEGRRPIPRCGPLGQDQTRGSINHSVLRVHRAARDPHRFPQQGLSRWRRPRGHDGACALITHWKRFVDSRRKPSQRARSQRCGDDGALRRARDRRSSHVRAGDEEAQV